VSIAMAFAGHMQIELIQPKDNHPSVYKEIVDRRGYGFHHVGIAVEDADAECAAYERRNYTAAYWAPVPSGRNRIAGNAASNNVEGVRGINLALRSR